MNLTFVGCSELYDSCLLGLWVGGSSHRPNNENSVASGRSHGQHPFAIGVLTSLFPLEIVNRLI